MPLNPVLYGLFVGREQSVSRSTERVELEKALGKSRRALPISLGFSILALIALWASHSYAGLPTWAALSLGFFATFGAVSDAINIPYCQARLRRLQAAGQAKQ